MRCAFCHREMAYIHGHAACVTSGCPMHGVNQAECCDGETAEASPVPTAVITSVPKVAVPIEPDPPAPEEKRAGPSRRGKASSQSAPVRSRLQQPHDARPRTKSGR